jgi:hypothetical protein
MPRDLEPTEDDPLAALVTGLAKQFLGHPGFMWSDDGFEVLHADWPAYPRGHGLRAALSALADFPSSESFYRIDSIDRCSLFLVGRKPDRNAFDKALFHVALWDDDLREGATHQLFAGVTVASEHLEFDGGAFSVTPKGEEVTLLFELTRRVHPDLFSAVESLLFIGRYDSAVREASIILENRLRATTPELAELSGHRLVDAWCERVFAGVLATQISNASRVELRASLRRFFTYVRNEFAHNLAEIGVVPTGRLLARCSLLFEVTRELARASGA